MPDNGENKRLKWIALILIPVSILCAGTVGYAARGLGEMDARVRIVEQDNAANGVRFEAIMRELDAIKKEMQK